MLNEYGGESVPLPIPKIPPQPDLQAGTPPTDEAPKVEEGPIVDLTDTSMRPSVKDVVKGALDHLNKHPDAALLAYRLLSQRFATSG